METVITSTEAVRNLGEILARVRLRHEVFVVTRNDRPVARLTPIEDRRRPTGADLERVLEALPCDPGFADDLEAVNRSDVPPEDPWA